MHSNSPERENEGEQSRGWEGHGAGGVAGRQGRTVRAHCVVTRDQAKAAGRRGLLTRCWSSMDPTWISKYWAGFVPIYTAQPRGAPSCSKAPFAGAGLSQKPRVLGNSLCVAVQAEVRLCGLT